MDCALFKLDIRTIRDGAQARQVRGFYCDWYPACRAYNSEARCWEFDETKRGQWRRYVRTLR